MSAYYNALGQTGELAPDDFRYTEIGPNLNTGFDAVDPDIAYNSADDEYLLVFSADRATSVGEDEIFGQRIAAASGNKIGTEFRISFMGTDGDTNFDAVEPSVSYNPATNQYLVVWHGDNVTNGKQEVHGQLINSGGTLSGTNFQISLAPGGSSADAVDAKVTTNTFSGEYMVVWSGGLTSNREIYAQVITSTGLLQGGLGTGATQLTQVAGLRSEQSSIAYNSNTNEYLVVFRVGVNTAEYNINAQLLRSDGSLVGTMTAPLQITNVAVGNDAGLPDVVYNVTEDKYFVVWEENTLGDYEIFGQYVFPTGTPEGGIGASVQISQRGTPTDGLQSDLPRVVWNSIANQFLVIWRAEQHNNAYEMYVEALDGTNLATIENDVVASSMGSIATSSTYSVINYYNIAYSTTSRRYLMVWEGDDDDAPTANGEFEIFGQQWEAFELPNVAITEWIASPRGTDATDEWIEIHNYGATAVDLQNWRLKDEDTNNSLISSTSLVIPAGGYLILARDKAAFEAQWLNGCSNARVIEVVFALANGTDEIVLEDANGNIVWSVAYQNDESVGRATHYTESTYSNRTWGSKATPGIVRNGNDVTATLGYEKNNSTADPLSYSSTNNDEGSPLNGSIVGTDLTRGTALEFNGTTGEVNLGNNASLDFDVNDAYTISTWVKVNASTSTNGQLISKFDGNTFVGWIFGYLGFTGDLNFTLANFNTGEFFEVRTGGFDIRDGQWHHVVVSYDGSTNANGVRLYVDGIENTVVASAGAVTASIQTAAPVMMGNYSAGSEYLDGSIDELQISNVVLSANTIREQMHLTADACQTGLVAYYQMNDGTGSTTLEDKTGNGNNGVLAGINTTTAWSTSGVNVGDDASDISNSETLTVPTGASTQAFSSANLSMNVRSHTIAEDFTVTYQVFSPNTTTGVNGVSIIQNPMWTLNTSTNTGAFVADLTFTYPTAVFTSTDPRKYALYHRTMGSDLVWTKLGTADAVTGNTITFNEIDQTGQFIVVQLSDALVSDVRGNMYTLGGSGAFIDCSATASGLPQGNTARTVEAWIKTTQTNIGNIVSWGQRANNLRNGVAVRSGRLGFIGQLNDRTGTAIINDGEWHHIAISHDGTTMRFYVDGVPDGAFPITLNTTDQNLRLGTISLPSTGEDYVGSFDEIRIWDVARSQDELRENLHLTLKGNESGLVAYYQFNNDDPVGTPNGVKDVSGNGNDGTATNMVATNYVASEVAVAGGTVDRINIGASGVYTFPNTGVQIEFGATTPNGELVVSRLETEKPTGWQSIGADVDDEYLVVNNYGTNQTFSVLPDLTINRMGYIDPTDAATPCTNLTLYKRPSNAFGATWGSARGCADAATAGAAGMTSYGSASGVITFSQIVAVNNGVASDLPVELLNFRAERKSVGTVQLEWMTATELNNSGFEIQRMLEDENTFEVVGWVDGKGTTTTTSFYSTIDPNGFEGVVYYRLKQIDFDGSFTYSAIRAVNGVASQGEGFEIYPNPTNRILNIRIKGAVGKVQLQVFNSQGVQMHQETVAVAQGGLTTLSNLQDLAKGVYVVQATTDEGEIYTQKFIKK
jgi:hypothetical protein